MFKLKQGANPEMLLFRIRLKCNKFHRIRIISSEFWHDVKCSLPWHSFEFLEYQYLVSSNAVMLCFSSIQHPSFLLILLPLLRVQNARSGIIILDVFLDLVFAQKNQKKLRRHVEKSFRDGLWSIWIWYGTIIFAALYSMRTFWKIFLTPFCSPLFTVFTQYYTCTKVCPIFICAGSMITFGHWRISH